MLRWKEKNVEREREVQSMMNVFWPEESGWSVSVSTVTTADSGVTGQ